MNEEEKQALIEFCKRLIDDENRNDAYRTKTEYFKLAKVAMAALTAEPVAWLTLHSIPPSYQEPDRGGEYLAVHEHPGEKSDDGTDAWPVYRKLEVT